MLYETSLELFVPPPSWWNKCDIVASSFMRVTECILNELEDQNMAPPALCGHQGVFLAFPGLSLG